MNFKRVMSTKRGGLIQTKQYFPNLVNGSNLRLLFTRPAISEQFLPSTTPQPMDHDSLFGARQLADLNNESEWIPPLDDLPRVTPFFFVPPLEDKPQNPIMDSLKLEKMNMNMLPRRPFVPQLPDEFAVLALDVDRIQMEERVVKQIEELWKGAVNQKLGVKNGILSWDRLRQSHLNGASSTPLLSEQGNLVSTSVRYYLQPRLYNTSDNIIYLTQRELLLNLKMIVIGLSSQYHVWDPTRELFLQLGSVPGEKQDFLIIDGNDEVITQSLVERFLRIGTLLRRLEVFILNLRTRSSKEGPTVHSFAHSLSTLLDYLRKALNRCPPDNDQLQSNIKDLPMMTIWTNYAIYEQLVDALSKLCGRNYAYSPIEYPTLDLSPINLLSRIYETLDLHFERQSPSVIRAALGFMLTTVSQDYLNKVSRSVGYAGQLPEKQSKRGNRTDRRQNFDSDDDQEEQQEDLFELLDEIQTSFPTFFPKQILHALPAAQKSLLLLQIAKPDHLLLSGHTKALNSDVRWFWSTDEIVNSWNGFPLPANSGVPKQTFLHPSSTSSNGPPQNGLADFRIFDLEPGTILSPESSLPANPEPFNNFNAFVKKFPETLPPIVPTFSELTSLVFRDLMRHSASLSSSLLSLIIDEPGSLNFRSHLVILKSYLLLGAPSFKSRLLNALFSDAGEYEINKTAHAMSVKQYMNSKSPKGKQQPWAVGLSPNLLERETWPPVGADLSFFLRTVIVDSLDRGQETEDGKFKREQVVEEAEWRLGFAIRDLPTGSGRDKWLNPLSIEALDFLYMDYKPPRLLEILIAPDILSKYQRIFTFVLRLLRVECALKSLFRMSTHRNVANFLFPTLTKSRRMLLHFRFVAQAFVSSVCGYVFDTAIGGNLDPFLVQLSPLSVNKSNQETSTRDLGFNDVFELATRHSALLDDVLSACLLRSGQRGVGDLLRQCLELVLELTIVVGELHRGRIEEYQASPMVEELFRQFCTKMTMLTKVLKGLVDKGPSSSNSQFTPQAPGAHQPTGGLEALHHLLIRIDITSWWSKQSKSELSK